MKTPLLCLLLIGGAGLMRADILESITFNLSDLHTGSTLSGTFDLPDSPVAGDTASAVLSFSDPSDYSPTSLTTTITIESGTPSGFAVDFSELTFTNLSGSTTPIDTKDVDLTGFAFAKCASFPCTASGGLQDRSPAVFTSTYTIAPVAAVPEPGSVYGLLTVIGVLGLIGKNRLSRPIR